MILFAFARIYIIEYFELVLAKNFNVRTLGTKNTSIFKNK